MSTTVTVTVPNHLMPRLVGPLNENLRLVEDAFEGTSIHARGNEFTIDGDDAAVAARLVDELRLLLEQGQLLDPAGGPPHHRHGAGRRAPLRGADRGGAAVGARAVRCGRRPAGRSATPTPSGTAS